MMTVYSNIQCNKYVLKKIFLNSQHLSFVLMCSRTSKTNLVVDRLTYRPDCTLYMSMEPV